MSRVTSNQLCVVACHCGPWCDKLESSESSDSPFGGRHRSRKVRDRFAEASDVSEEARAILQHWHFEDKKSRSEMRHGIAERLAHGHRKPSRLYDLSRVAETAMLEEPQAKMPRPAPQRPNFPPPAVRSTPEAWVERGLGPGFIT